MGLVDDLKTQVKKSGANKGKFLYFKSGVKLRVRFLHDLEDGKKYPFHDSYTLGVNIPCQELFGKSCGYCDSEELRHRDQYAWCVYEYESKEVRILKDAVSSASPVSQIVAMFDAYGTLLDRDYVITRNGTGKDTTYTVVPMDKSKFKNTKVKPFSDSKMLELLNKAWPDENAEDDDEEEDEKPTTKRGKGKDKDKGSKKGKGKQKDEEDDEEDDWEDDEEETPDYDEMSAKELYLLCKERDIEVKPKKSEEFYIKKLTKWDEENKKDEEDEEDEW